MQVVEIKIPENCKISNIGFASTLVSEACKYTSDDINIKTDDNIWVNLKSIMGVITLNYGKSSHISLQVFGENENYTASSIKKKIEALFKMYITE